jgi:hypothetical protein
MAARPEASNSAPTTARRMPTDMRSVFIKKVPGHQKKTVKAMSFGGLNASQYKIISIVTLIHTTPHRLSMRTHRHNGPLFLMACSHGSHTHYNVCSVEAPGSPVNTATSESPRTCPNPIPRKKHTF